MDRIQIKFRLGMLARSLVRAFPLLSSLTLSSRLEPGLGQAGCPAMSALPPKADIREMPPQTERPPRGGLSEIRSGAIQTPQLLVCLCATFEHADARLEAVLPGFGGLYLCLIRQQSKQNLAFNLYGRRELNLFSKPSSQDFHLSISLEKKHGALRCPL